jgi:hypothetical protein
MIYKPDQKVMQAFRAMRGNQNFEVILKFLKDCRDRTDAEGRSEPQEHRLRWNQGSTKTIDEIIRLYEESKQLS